MPLLMVRVLESEYHKNFANEIAGTIGVIVLYMQFGFAISILNAKVYFTWFK